MYQSTINHSHYFGLTLLHFNRISVLSHAYFIALAFLSVFFLFEYVYSCMQPHQSLAILRRISEKPNGIPRLQMQVVEGEGKTMQF